jgi:hypothetical protein
MAAVAGDDQKPKAEAETKAMILAYNSIPHGSHRRYALLLLHGAGLEAENSLPTIAHCILVLHTVISLSNLDRQWSVQLCKSGEQDRLDLPRSWLGKESLDLQMREEKKTGQ